MRLLFGFRLEACVKSDHVIWTTVCVIWIFLCWLRARRGTFVYQFQIGVTWDFYECALRSSQHQEPQSALRRDGLGCSLGVVCGKQRLKQIRLNGGQQFVSNHLASAPESSAIFAFPLVVCARVIFHYMVLAWPAGGRRASCKLQLTALPPVVQFTLGRAPLFFYRRVSSANHLPSWMRCQRFLMTKHNFGVCVWFLCNVGLECICAVLAPLIIRRRRPLLQLVYELWKSI